jgi:rRNA maturation protein Nop10
MDTVPELGAATVSSTPCNFYIAEKYTIEKP